MRDLLSIIQEGDKLEASMGDRAKGITAFDEKLAEFTGLLANVKGYSANKRRYLLKEAETTSDFPTLFGTVLERQIRAKYKLVDADYRSYIKTGTQNDFRTSWDMALYGNRAILGFVKERGEYKDRQLNDGKFTIQVGKWGGGFSLSWEAMINDDLGAFSDIANDLAISASETEAYYATQLFAASNSNPFKTGDTTGYNSTLYQTSGTHPIDSTTFTNKNTLSLNGSSAASNLATSITALKSQKDYDGNPIIFKSFHLVVPVNLEFAALGLLSTNALIAALSTTGPTNAPFGSTSENIIARYGIKLHVNPWLDQNGSSDAKYTWFLFGDPADGDAVRMNFLRGHESPEICQKMSDKISLGGAPISPLEGDFDSDTIKWRVRHVFGGTQTDPRFTYVNVASS